MQTKVLRGENLLCISDHTSGILLPPKKLPLEEVMVGKIRQLKQCPISHLDQVLVLSYILKPVICFFTAKEMVFGHEHWFHW